MRNLLFLCILLGIIHVNSLASDTLKINGSDNTIRYQIENKYDYIPENFNYDLIGDRVACIEGEIALNYNERVYSFINYFVVKDREYTKEVVRKHKYYFPIFEKYLKQYGLPDELKYLAIVESGLNTKAISRAGAGGLWQFMPYTGRSYGLHQDFYIDERFDPEKATEAACRYLKMLHGMFGDWELALASYNSGPGNVRKAIRRSGYKKSFWEIYRYLPRETRSYVPQFVALTYAMNYTEEHNLVPENFEYEMKYDTVMVNEFMNLEILAKELDICDQDLKKLNPAIKWFAIPSTAKAYPLRLPLDKISAFNERRDSLLVLTNQGQARMEYLARNTPGSTYGRQKIVYRVRSGDVLGTIAGRYHVRVSDLRKWNNIRGSMIRAGQRLNIWIHPGNTNDPLNSTIASSSNLKSSPTNDPTPPKNLTASTKSSTTTNSPKTSYRNPTTGQLTHIVQPGDTLWDISKMYEGSSIEEIKKVNKLENNKIKPGQTLIIGSK